MDDYISVSIADQGQNCSKILIVNESCHLAISSASAATTILCRREADR